LKKGKEKLLGGEKRIPTPPTRFSKPAGSRIVSAAKTFEGPLRRSNLPQRRKGFKIGTKTSGKKKQMYSNCRKKKLPASFETFSILSPRRREGERGSSKTGTIGRKGSRTSAPVFGEGKRKFCVPLILTEYFFHHLERECTSSQEERKRGLKTPKSPEGGEGPCIQHKPNNLALRVFFSGKREKKIGGWKKDENTFKRSMPLNSEQRKRLN